jgi:hypothetical protein
MVLVVKRKISAVFAGGLLVAVFAAAPARAEDDTLFGQPAPKQFLLNKMLNPQSSQPVGNNAQPAGAGGQGAGANGQAAGSNGQAAGAGAAQTAAGEAADADDDGPGPYPKRYLLNKLFDGNK